MRDGYDLRGSRTVRHKRSVVRLCYSARVTILQVSFKHGENQLYE